jgi:hypothetical protein
VNFWLSYMKHAHQVYILNLVYVFLYLFYVDIMELFTNLKTYWPNLSKVIWVGYACVHIFI